MAENKSPQMNERKIRRQYFTVPVLMHYVLMPFVPYCILIFSIQLGKFNMQEWISSIWMSVWICFCFSIPWVILKILNKACFGKIICVLTEEGIHYKDGFIEWNRITKIEYIIDRPSRYTYCLERERKCRAIVHTGYETITLLQAPHSILRSVKKFQPQIKTQLSNGSKWLIAITVLLSILVPFTSFFT